MNKNNVKIFKIYLLIYIYINKISLLKFSNLFFNLSFLRFMRNKELIKTTAYLFMFDLFLRWPKSNLKYFKKIIKRRLFLPVLSNLHLIRNFLIYSGLKLLVGNKRVLPMFISRVSIFSPFLTLKTKKSFWKSFYWSFLLIKHSFHKLSFYKIVNSHIIKSNLLINLTVNTRLKIIKYALSIKWLKNIKSSVVRKLFMVSKLFINNLKNKSNLTNFLIVNECSYLLNSFSSNKSTNRKVFSFSRQKRFKSVWDYKRSIFYIRHQRNILKRMFCLKGKHYMITHFIKKLYRNKSSGFYSLIRVELKLKFLLIRSRFCTSNQESTQLIQQGLVYLNNSICYNPDYILKLNDKIQLAFHVCNFTSFRHSYSYLIAQRHKLNIYKVTKSWNSKHNKTPVQHYTGKWIYKNEYNNIKVPRYLEVDYITLSFIVVYLPISLKQIFALNWKHFKFLNIRYYNWKYLY